MDFDEKKKYTWCIIYDNRCNNIIERVHIINGVTEETILSRIVDRPDCKVSITFRAIESDAMFTQFEEITGCILDAQHEYVLTYDHELGDYIVEEYANIS